MSRSLTYCEAINEALALALESDPRVVLMGEGIGDPKSIFGSTRGLQDRFGRERVLDLPLSEGGMTGVMVGAALSGLRPIMTHQRVDFILYAMDQIVNHAAKRCYASGGRQSVPMTIRAVIGRGWGQGPQHSQSFQAFFLHVPGLRVVMPATPYDVKGLLLASIEDPNPVIFIEHRLCYAHSGEVPEGYYTVPLGKAAIRREGNDVTVVAVSYMVSESLTAAQLLLQQGIGVELIDLRSVKPWDEACVIGSVKKTGRLVIVDTAWKTGGIGAEISARVCEEAFSSLKAPIARVGLPDAPTPTSSALEKVYYPGPAQIAQVIQSALGMKRLGTALSEDLAVTRNVAQTFQGPF